MSFIDNDQEIHSEILGINHQFFIFREYGEMLHDVKYITNVHGKLLDSLNETDGLFICLHDNVITIRSIDKDKLKYVLDDVLTYKNSEGEYVYEYFGLDFWKVIIKYCNPALKAPLLVHILIMHLLGNKSSVKNMWLRKIEPNFLLSIVEQKNNVSILRIELLTYVIDNYDNLDCVCYVGDRAVFLFDDKEEEEKQCTYKEFKQIVDNLYYGYNADYNILKLDSWECRT